MKLKIRSITKRDYKKAHKLQCTYLDEENFEDFKKRVESNPDLYLGAVNNGLLKKLEEYSKSKSVNIWTGGDLKEIVSHLQEFKIEYPLLSKNWFNGCEVEIAIDDLPREKFEKDYGIKVREYQKVNPKEWLGR